MTEIELLTALKEYCKDITKDMRLCARVPKNGTQEKEREPKVFVGNLPDKEAEKKEAPYILLQMLTSKAEENESTCRVRIICMTFSEDKQENYVQCLNLVTKIRNCILEDVVIDKRFVCKKPVETIIYGDDLEIYQIGEIMTIWTIPQAERNIAKYLQP